MKVYPIVSVIVPVYKVEKYIKKCVNSIVNQTHKDLEIILVDDGSPDKSGAICDRLAKKDSRIRVIHKENGGVSSARNAGIEAAKGEYICFVDSDDWLPENAIELLINKLREDNSDFCVGEADCVAIRYNSKLEKLTNMCFNEENFHKVVELDKLLRSPWAKIFKTDIIIDNNIRFILGISYSEDAIFVWNYLACCNRISSISATTYYYSLLNSDNASAKYYSEVADWLYLYIKALERVIEKSSTNSIEKRQIVCKMAVKCVLSIGGFYARRLEQQKEILYERLAYTVRLFGEYLFDNALTFDDSMSKEKTAFELYIITNDYKGLASYILNDVGKEKKSTIQIKIRNIVLWLKREWIYRVR